MFAFKWQDKKFHCSIVCTAEKLYTRTITGTIQTQAGTIKVNLMLTNSQKTDLRQNSDQKTVVVVVVVVV